MSWSDARVDALRSLWVDGFSASQIAARLGNVTRNAVIGKVHRLGLPGHGASSRPTVRSPRSTPPAIGRNRTRSLLRRLAANGAPLPAAEKLVVPLHERKTTLTLTANCCRWPIGDPKEPGFHFCGRSRLTELPYCEVHARRAFRVPHARAGARELPPTSALPGPGAPRPRNLAPKTHADAASLSENT